MRAAPDPCSVAWVAFEYGPRPFVVPDHLVVRPPARIQTYYDPGACHVSFSDPYCTRLRGHLLDGLAGHDPVDGGAMVVIEGRPA